MSDDLRDTPVGNCHIKKVPSSVAKLIGSACVITSPVSVVKELLDNALDAGANIIEIRLESFGLNRIEVRDDGCGLSPEDAKCAALQYYTSKLQSSDLSQVNTYGFRGVALSSICQVGNVSIITKTRGEGVGRMYIYNENGIVASENKQAATFGCVVVVTNLFKCLPVRQQYFNNANKKKDVIKQIETIVKSYGIIINHLRLNVYHDKKLIWQKLPTLSMKLSFEQLFEFGTKNQWDGYSYRHPNSELCIYCVLPLKTSKPHVTSRSHSQFSFVFVNKRPVQMSFVHQLVKCYYNQVIGLSGSQCRNPCYAIAIAISPEDVDVNVEPNKRTVFLSSQVQEQVQTSLKEILEKFYEVKVEDNDSCQMLHQTSSLNTSEVLNTSMTADSAPLIDDFSVNDELEIPKEFLEEIENVDNLKLDVAQNAIMWTSGLAENVQMIDAKQKENSIRQIQEHAVEVIHVIHKKSPYAVNRFEAEKSLKKDNLQQKRLISSYLEKVEGEPAKKLKNNEARERISEQQCKKLPKKLDIFRPTKISSLASSKAETKHHNSSEFNQQKVPKCSVNDNVVNCLQTGAVMRKSFSIEKLRAVFASERHKDQHHYPNNEIRLVGQLHNGTWIVCHDNILSTLNYNRLQETVLYHKLLATHRIIAHDVEVPKVINERHLGTDAYDTLLKLSRKKVKWYTSEVDDERILKNGFCISFTEDPNYGIVANLMGIASHLDSYSLNDLIECLVKIKVNPSIDLYNCRNEKVKDYLKNEAIRLNHTRPLSITLEDMQDILSETHNFLPEEYRYTCLHGRSFYEKLHDFNVITDSSSCQL